MLGIGINYFERTILNFVSFLLLCSFFLPSFPWLGFTGQCPATFPWKAGSPAVGSYQTNVWYSPLRRSLPFCGALALLAICLRKSGPPQDRVLENHQGSGELFPCQVGRKYHQGGSGSPPSLFSERTFTSSPHQSTSSFPVRRKTPRPMGLRLAKTRSLEGGVRAVGEPDEKLENRIPGYQLGYRSPCGLE